METKIASYQEPGVRLQLVKIENWDYDPEIVGDLAKMVKIYQIRKNRKILCTLKWETPARQKFNAIIQKYLLQTSINYEEEKQ